MSRWEIKMIGWLGCRLQSARLFGVELLLEAASVLQAEAQSAAAIGAWR